MFTLFNGWAAFLTPRGLALMVNAADMWGLIDPASARNGVEFFHPSFDGSEKG